VRAPDLQDLVLLDASEAVRRHLEALNYRSGRVLWWILLFISVGGILGSLDLGSPVRWIAASVNLAGLLALVPLRRSEAFQRNFSTLLLALLSVEVLLWEILPTEEGLAIAFSCVVVAPALVLLRLRAIEVASVAVLTTGVAYLRMLVLPAGENNEAAMSLAGVLAIAIVTTVAALIGSSATSRRRQEFLLTWRQAASRERERLRMREELHDARAIQLAMLPTEPPLVAGLELAGVCVPATEVGGDYYGYFPGTAGTLGVAIGDVAGHGVASGLVLAGVRAGLLLLADEVASDPATALARLNAVVGAPGGQRLLMTLGLALFDPPRGRATWVAAGHPPPLRFDAARRLTESPSTGHPPLGTRLPLRLETVERELAPGDVWLLVSDGAIEARDRHHREFGERLLERAFEQLAARGLGAGAIVDGLLAELTRFREGEPLVDDLTLVVVRVTGPE